MKKIIRGLSIVNILIMNCFAMNTAYANNNVNKPPIKTKNTVDKEALIKNLFPYLSLSGGYGSFQYMAQNSGETSFARLALGFQSQERQRMTLGGEIGIQSAKRMVFGNQTVAPFFVNTLYPLPIYLTINPPIDMLASLTYHLVLPVFFEVKAGAVYMQSMIDQADITGTSQWAPELQLGVGFGIANKTRLIFNYQHFFGSTPRLNNIDIIVGTANLGNLPTWQAGMITLEKSF